MRSKDLYKGTPVRPKVVARVAANDPVRLALHHTMKGMLDEILDEDSSISSAVRNSPYADVLIKNVHKALAIPANTTWKPEDKVSWTDVKRMSPNFVLLAGSRGTAAIRWGGSQWEGMVASGSGVRTFRSGSIGEVVGDMKEGLGIVMGYWTAVGVGERERYGRGASSNSTGPVEKLRRDREDARKFVNPTVLDPKAPHSQNMDAILVKLRPVFAKYIQHAIADVKGAIGMALKNDAYNKVKNKVEILERLKAVQEELLDNKNALPEHIKTKLRPALYLTASYFYPEETGNFTLGTSYRSTTLDNLEGARKVVRDIANGDSKKLITLMNYLKQMLLHG